ncbi:MAG: tRNA dihydrouridine(20/20a) synthase DusA [Alphaproteobacteria bacterium]
MTGRLDRRLSVAPMMDCTDRHFRYFARLLTKRTLLYTEMVTTGAILHGDRSRFLKFDPRENPLALQLGGSDPAALAACARLAEAWGYDEVNLNVGCPSDRVQSGRFGACLMAEPDLVAACVDAMRQAVSIPVTVKTRIGIDDRDRYEDLVEFVSKVRAGGATVFIIHARKAWLSGLSPRENRDIPPLRYDVAARLKADFPDLRVILNGGLRTFDAAREALAQFDGAMIGRAAYEMPYMLAEADRAIFGATTAMPTRVEIVEGYLPYVDASMAEGVPLWRLARPLVGLYHGQPGARAWRRRLAEEAHRADNGIGHLRAALDAVLQAGAALADAA